MSHMCEPCHVTEATFRGEGNREVTRPPKFLGLFHEGALFLQGSFANAKDFCGALLQNRPTFRGDGSHDVKRPAPYCRLLSFPEGERDEGMCGRVRVKGCV